MLCMLSNILTSTAIHKIFFTRLYAKCWTAIGVSGKRSQLSGAIGTPSSITKDLKQDVPIINCKQSQASAMAVYNPSAKPIWSGFKWLSGPLILLFAAFFAPDSSTGISFIPAATPNAMGGSPSRMLQMFMLMEYVSAAVNIRTVEVGRRER